MCEFRTILIAAAARISWMEGKKEEPPKKVNRSRNIVSRRVRIARELFPGFLTQDQLSGRLAAQKTLIDRPAIAKIETGTRGVNDFEVVALAKALKVDVRWLLGIQETGGPEFKERSLK
jgi:hypothetical protein